jgi:hypothetical protein
MIATNTKFFENHPSSAPSPVNKFPHRPADCTTSFFLQATDFGGFVAGSSFH